MTTRIYELRLSLVLSLALAILFATSLELSAAPADGDNLLTVPVTTERIPPEVQHDKVALDDDEVEEKEEDNDKQESNDDKKEESSDEEEKESDDSEKDADEKDSESGDKKDEESKDKEEKEKEVSLSGRFVATRMTPVSRRLEEWSDMTIKSIVDHGKQVKAGDTLVTLEMEDIDESISDLEHSIKVDKIGLQQSLAKLELLRRTTKLDLEDARREQKIAQEDADLFFKRDKARSVEQNEFSFKSRKNFLSYQEEELKQLLKMYEADDLTEETEEIILKRTRDQVESARFSFKGAELNYKDFPKYDLPRRQTRVENSAATAAIALERAEATLPAALKEQELALQMEETTLKRKEEKLATLKRDHKEMTIKAPRAGIVFYGECDNGVFDSVRSLSKKMKPHGTLSSGKVFMTILDVRPMRILADIPEGDLQHIQRGATLEVSPTAFPDMELNAKVKSISKYPVEDGKFAAELTVRLGNKNQQIVPGMTCDLTMKIKADEKDDKKDKKAAKKK